MYSAPTNVQLRHKCLPVLHQTRQQTISQLDADMQIKQWKKRKETKQDKGRKRGSKEGERRSAERGWLIIGVVWRRFCLTTRPPSPVSSLCVNLIDTSLNILAYWSVNIHLTALSCFFAFSLFLLTCSLSLFHVSSLHFLLHSCLPPVLLFCL